MKETKITLNYFLKVSQLPVWNSYTYFLSLLLSNLDAIHNSILYIFFTSSLYTLHSIAAAYHTTTPTNISCPNYEVIVVKKHTHTLAHDVNEEYDL